MQEITLTLSLAEANQILEALGELPYVRVYELIAKIQQQAQVQLGAQPQGIDVHANGLRGENAHDR
jgi:hypothetical protein